MVTLEDQYKAPYVFNDGEFDYSWWLDDAHVKMQDGTSLYAWDIVEETAKLMAMHRKELFVWQLDDDAAKLLERIKGRCDALEVLCGGRMSGVMWYDLVVAHSDNYNDDGTDRKWWTE